MIATASDETVTRWMHRLQEDYQRAEKIFCGTMYRADLAQTAFDKVFVGVLESCKKVFEKDWHEKMAALWRDQVKSVLDMHNEYRLYVMYSMREQKNLKNDRDWFKNQLKINGIRIPEPEATSSGLEVERNFDHKARFIEAEVGRLNTHLLNDPWVKSDGGAYDIWSPIPART